MSNHPAPPPTNPSRQRQAEFHRLRMRAIGLSVGVSILLLGFKLWTYHLTNSAAVLSDALESIINVAASLFAVASIWMAAKPPDPDHPYGHGKIEYFSAGFEGALIIGAAIGIFYTGVRHLAAPRPLPHLESGLLILAAATVINLGTGTYLVRVGRRTDSLALIADGKHLLTDVYSSAAVIIGLLLVYLTGWVRLDGAVACLVGINILVSGGGLIGQSYKRLMDASDPELLDRIAGLLAARKRPEWIDIHQLRAWRAGSMVHIDLHLVLPEHMLLNQAHQEVKILEKMLDDEFDGNAGILVHMDPCQPDSCPICRRHSCQRRTSEEGPPVTWSRERLVRSENAGRNDESET